MIKDKLPPTLQPSQIGKIPGQEFDYEIFSLPTKGELLTPQMRYDRQHPTVRAFYELLAPVMIWYVRPGADWDLIEVAHLPIHCADETVVISSPEGQVQGVSSIEFDDSPGFDAAKVNGIVVNPEVRGSGIASWILGYFANQHQPEILHGNTNSEVAAFSRSQILKRYGYTTFIGGQLIATPSEEITGQEERLFKKWSRYRHYQKPDESGVVILKAPYPKFKKTDRITEKPKSIDDAMWANLTKVFDRIEREQETDPESLIQAPLVSVKRF